MVQEILDGARRSFARSGYHRTSIKAIAKEAGIRSPSILHYHFHSKQEIFLAVMRSAIAELAERATEVGLGVSEGSPGLGALDAFFTLLDEADDLSPLLIECFAIGMRGEHREELNELLSGLEGLVEDATRKLLGDEADRLQLSTRALAAAVVDLLTGHAIRSRLSPNRDELRERRAGVLTLLGLVRPAPKEQE